MKMSLALLAVAALGAASSAYAGTYNESGDAGDMPGTSQPAAGVGSLTDIFGSVGGLQDADMYVINITAGGGFSATTNIAPGTMVDTTLYLFNMDGTGIAKNDDVSSTNFLSDLSAGASQYSSLPAGQYILAVGGFAFAPYYTGPVTTADLIFDVNTFTGVLSPQAGAAGQPILGWADAGTYDSGTYHITLTGATMVPAPASLALLGFAGLGARRRRKA